MILLRDYALRLVGAPYKWGGRNPIEGFDCSGLVQVILAAAGMDPPGDQTAQGLYDHFERQSVYATQTLGSLAFFGESVTKITHVAFCLDRFRMIEAGGGNHLTLTPQDAAKQDAWVKISMTSRRPDLVALLKPRYSTIGVI